MIREFISIFWGFDKLEESNAKLMGMLYGAQVQTMMPKLHSTNFEGMELIRPLYLVRQDDIIAWQRYNKHNFLDTYDE